MIVTAGDRVHVIERRLFANDVRRHFFGAVEEVEGPLIRVVGYLWVFDSGSSRYIRTAALRTRVISLASGGLVINLAPPGTNVDDVVYADVDGNLTVTDGGDFSLVINEFGSSR